jgi:hypothetical protein
MRILRPALLYFALVFGAGFVLGPLRVLFVVPHIGARAAELAEMPLMLVVIWLAARWIARRGTPPPAPGERIAIGTLAAVLVMLADIGVGIALRGLSLAEIFTGRDPVSGTAFYLALVFCALAPRLAGVRTERWPSSPRP